MTALLSAHALTVTIAGLTVCRDLDLRVSAGSRWAILGRNGVGKTTLLLTLAGLHAAEQGEVRMEGRPLAAWPRRLRARRLGVLFQETATVFPGSVLETVLIGRHPYLEHWRWEGEDDIEIARAALAEVGLGGTEDRNVATLSGGERQRLAIATVLCQSPALWLLDEPTNHLDPHHQIAVMETVRRVTAAPGLSSAGCAAIMVLHDVNLAIRYCDHAMLLHGDGVIEHGPAASVITPQGLRRLYGHPMEPLAANGDRIYYVPGGES